MEDREILEKYLQECESKFLMGSEVAGTELYKPIINILKENENLKQAIEINKNLYEEVCNKNKELEEEKARYEHKYEIAFNKLIEYEKTLEKLQKETIWKSLIKEKIEELDKKIKCLHEELTKCCEERDKLGTETEIDNNEVRIFTLEKEIDELHTQKQVLQELLRRGEVRWL